MKDVILEIELPEGYLPKELYPNWVGYELENGESGWVVDKVKNASSDILHIYFKDIDNRGFNDLKYWLEKDIDSPFYNLLQDGDWRIIELEDSFYKDWYTQNTKHNDKAFEYTYDNNYYASETANSIEEYLPITVRNQGDYAVFAEAVNKGIDSHLEAFTKSKFFQKRPGEFGQKI